MVKLEHIKHLKSCSPKGTVKTHTQTKKKKKRKQNPQTGENIYNAKNW